MRGAGVGDERSIVLTVSLAAGVLMSITSTGLVGLVGLVVTSEGAAVLVTDAAL